MRADTVLTLFLRFSILGRSIAVIEPAVAPETDEGGCSRGTKTLSNGTVNIFCFLFQHLPLAFWVVRADAVTTNGAPACSAFFLEFAVLWSRSIAVIEPTVAPDAEEEDVPVVPKPSGLTKGTVNVFVSSFNVFGWHFVT